MQIHNEWEIIRENNMADHYTCNIFSRFFQNVGYTLIHCSSKEQYVEMRAFSFTINLSHDSESRQCLY